ncbi:hypothetical protein ZYGR_0AS04450 [Zygosaccharomyces rouxii]|uniref:Defective in cullin neddylation protein n=1 Tax=Zygosaccharomyces rouxii TaxID=4956 RepID=A0A1Q3AHM0_ZYGRO|nr:hypothetical protein ZYGR_0AS04450 [Zygosaccharomyces rouxii]
MVLTFKSLAQCSDRTARDYLNRHHWDVNQALNDYYDSEHDQDRSYSPELSQLFMKYAVTTPRGSIMDTDGLIKYIGDLGYEIDNLATICLAQLLHRERLTDSITEGQFSYNWQQNGCTTLHQMRKLMQKLDHKLHTDQDYMAQVYNYTFELALDPGAKTLETHTAVQYWTLFFASGQYPVTVMQQLFQLWVSFVEQEQSISRDTWQMLFPFFNRFSNLQLVRDNYNEADAWPYIIDEFYEYLTDKGEI